MFASCSQISLCPRQSHPGDIRRLLRKLPATLRTLHVCLQANLSLLEVDQALQNVLASINHITYLQCLSIRYLWRRTSASNNPRDSIEDRLVRFSHAPDLIGFCPSRVRGRATSIELKLEADLQLSLEELLLFLQLDVMSQLTHISLSLHTLTPQHFALFVDRMPMLRSLELEVQIFNCGVGSYGSDEFCRYMQRCSYPDWGLQHMSVVNLKVDLESSSWENISGTRIMTAFVHALPNAAMFNGIPRSKYLS
ncbi:hypothetical protein D9613_002295 [Agrocybe pediades]|uniref:Uncharacterized protein n=1 Tax=Agrocybe pediades TaxID=84607 RepID=A0A8H4R462_9AGAR|nr:hypothetical protein D9613_002295 [Agrocybe pediades]